MINVSNAFKQELFNDRRNYLEYVDITLKDETVLNLKNKDLWGGGLTIEDAVSKDNSFDVGSAIINKCTVVINNIYDDYSEYDFEDAKVVAYVGLKLPDGTIERIRKGTYTVDETAYNGSIITLSCLDNMSKFDKPYSESKLNYPATLNQIIRDACDVCSATLQTYNFPHDNFVVQTRPNDEAITFREIISWCAQIACCFCRCDTLGRLELKWYNQQALEKDGLDGGVFDSLNPNKYATGDNADGGSFNPWNTGYVADGGTFGDRDDIHYIYSTYSLDISTDDVVITGVKVVEKNKEENQDALTTYQSGTEGYVVSVENNELIKGGAGQTIVGWLGEQLIGFRFRKANIAHASDPTIEAGDVGILIDRKQNAYRIMISSTKFSTGSNQTTTSSAQNPARNSAARFSTETKNYVELRKDIEKERTDREKAQDELKDRIDNSSGLFTTEVAQPDGSTIFFMHDKPALDESMIVWKMTAEAFAVSTDGGETYNAGLTVDGDLIARILTATGINADWINAGTISANRIKGGYLLIGGVNNELGYIRMLDNMLWDGQRQILSQYDTNGLTYYHYLYSGASGEKHIASYVFGSYGYSYIVDGIKMAEISPGLHTDDGLMMIPKKKNVGFVFSDGSNTYYLRVLPEEKQITPKGYPTDSGIPLITYRYGMECGIPSYFSSFWVNGRAYFDTASADFLNGTTNFYSTVYFKQYCAVNVEDISSFTFKGISAYSTSYSAVFSGSSTGRLGREMSSSIRYKKIMKNMDQDNILMLYHIQPVIAKYKEGYLAKEDPRVGVQFPMLIAEDVEKHFPEAVDYNENGEVENWNHRIMIPAMFQMIKSQKETIDTQEKEIEKLKERLERIEMLLTEGSE